MTLRKNIGQQIAMLRKGHGLTVRQLAELTGINYANICKIENGKYNVSIDILNKICSVLGARITIECINTLEELRHFVNSNEEWLLAAKRVIELNQWTDETELEYGICNDGERRLYFSVDSNQKLIASIKNI